MSIQPYNLNLTSGLFTDFYELTMMQGYLEQQHNPPAVFDFFFRRPPFDGGYAVFAGLQTVLQALSHLHFNDEELEYLRSTGQFHDSFLKYLKNYRFSGTIYSMPEGSLVFPREPILRVHAPLAEAQLIESLLLNVLNFQTLIATKAARMRESAQEGPILEFGLRRAQGPDGGLTASRAAYIGGVGATSNTLAGKVFGIPVRGTMAHSWVMAFDNEEEAFRAYADLYPDSSIFLIDTYDTLKSGLPAAMKVGAELTAKGHNWGVRLDSGDLAYLSQEVRARLDDNNLPDVKIVVSNELNEHVIHQLVTDNAPIDSWGVGTHMVTGESDPSLTGVFKLAAKKPASGNGFTPVLKLSNNPEKTTDPGIKQVYRYKDRNGLMLADLIALESETIPSQGKIRLHHPLVTYGVYDLCDYAQRTPLLEKVLDNGEMCKAEIPLEEIQAHALREMKNLHPTHKRLLNPHTYKVSFSTDLYKLKQKMTEEYMKE
ncbi:MAG: nicotinate phosphoribosyltransferase [Spirochaeta sp.]